MRSLTTRRGRGIAGATLVALVLATSACGSDDEGGGTASGDGGTTTLKVAAGAKLLTDWDDYVADAKGYYTEHGLTIDRVTTQTASAAAQLQVTGEIQIGRGLPPAVQADVNSNGAVHQISVADTLIRPPFTVNAAAEITSYEDLVGKTVAVSTPTDSTTVVTDLALQQLGLPLDQIELNPVGGSADRLAGLQQGAVQATALLPPLNFQAEAAGFHRLGYLPDDLGDDFQFAFNSVIVDRDWAEDNKDVLVSYLAARNDALKFMADPANAEEVASILAEATGIEQDVATQVYDLTIGGQYSAFNTEIGIDTAAAQGVLDGLQAGGFLKQHEDAADYTDDSYAKAARDGS